MALPLVPFIASVALFFKGVNVHTIAVLLLLAGVFKFLLITLFTVTLSIVLKNFGVDWIMSGYDAVFNSFDTEVPSFVMNLTGLGAWLAQLLRLPESISIVVSGMLIGFFRSVVKI